MRVFEVARLRGYGWIGVLTGIIVASTPAPHPHLVYNASLLAKTWSLLQTEDTAGSLRGALARVDTEARNHLQASVNSVSPDDVIAFKCKRRLSFHTFHTKKLLGGAGGVSPPPEERGRSNPSVPLSAGACCSLSVLTCPRI